MATLRLPQSYDYVVVVPAYRESSKFLNSFPQLEGKRVLLILVINQPDDDENRIPQHHLHRDVIFWGDETISSSNVSFTKTAHSYDILTVDRYQKGERILRRQGVGAARHIGNALATHFIENGDIKSPWLFNTDADASLPQNYFEAVEDVPEEANMVRLGTRLDDYITEDGRYAYLVETMFDYQQKAINWAGIDQTFVNYGSNIIYHSAFYKKTGGFPCVPTGEDTKLVSSYMEYGWCHDRLDIEVLLTTRLSTRVPFGLGPLARKIGEGLSKGKPFRVIAAREFEYMSEIVSFCKAYESGGDWNLLMDGLSERAKGWSDFENFKNRDRSIPLNRWFTPNSIHSIMHSVVCPPGIGMALPITKAIEESPFSNLDDYPRLKTLKRHMPL